MIKRKPKVLSAPLHKLIRKLLITMMEKSNNPYLTTENKPTMFGAFIELVRQSGKYDMLEQWDDALLSALAVAAYLKNDIIPRDHDSFDIKKYEEMYKKPEYVAQISEMAKALPGGVDYIKMRTAMDDTPAYLLSYDLLERAAFSACIDWSTHLATTFSKLNSDDIEKEIDRNIEIKDDTISDSTISQHLFPSADLKNKEDTADEIKSDPGDSSFDTLRPDFVQLISASVRAYKEIIRDLRNEKDLINAGIYYLLKLGPCPLPFRSPYSNFATPRIKIVY